MSNQVIQIAVIAVSAVALVFCTTSVATARWIVVEGDENYSSGLFAYSYRGVSLSRNVFWSAFGFSISSDEDISAARTLILCSLVFLLISTFFVAMNLASSASNRSTSKSLKIGITLLTIAGTLLFIGLVVVSANKHVARPVDNREEFTDHVDFEVVTSRQPVQEGSGTSTVDVPTLSSSDDNSEEPATDSTFPDDFYNDLLDVFGKRKKRSVHPTSVHALDFGYSYVLGWLAFFAEVLAVILALVAMHESKEDKFDEKPKKLPVVRA